jgi:esterase/lipase superfamily enzyme
VSEVPRSRATAPDVDADTFRRDLAPAIVNAAGRVTLYASSNDEALIASRKVHGYRRAGESGDTMVVVPGVDTVDVSEVDTSFIGHSYYGSNSTVLADLFELMQGSKPADQRKWLHSMQLGAMKYWKFLRSQADNLLSGKEL